jgi:LPXTG-motif cell wall-anchored protein
VSTPLPPPGSRSTTSTTSTQEIPVVPAALANTQHLPPPPPAETPDGTRTTGPVDFVPQPPAPGASGTAKTPRAVPIALLVPAAAALGVVVLELGLLRFGTRSLWSQVPLWSAFATVAAALVLLAAAVETLRGRRRLGPARRVAGAAAGGLAVFWLLVALPTASSDRGFLLTAGVALLAAAAWLGRRRREG